MLATRAVRRQLFRKAKRNMGGRKKNNANKYQKSPSVTDLRSMARGPMNFREAGLPPIKCLRIQAMLNMQMMPHHVDGA